MSKKIAQKLGKSLPCFIQSVKTFCSTQDIQKGSIWCDKLIKNLDESDFGIVCLVDENVDSKWLYFEAGALVRGQKHNVCVINFNNAKITLDNPLSMFQDTKFNKEDFYELIKDINEMSGKALEEELLKNSFEMLWESLYEDINNIIREYKQENIQHLNLRNKEVQNNANKKSFNGKNDIVLDYKDKFYIFYTKASDFWCNSHFGEYKSDFLATQLSKEAIEELTRYKENNELKKINVLGLYFGNINKTCCKIQLTNFYKEDNKIKFSFNILEDTQIQSSYLIDKLGEQFSYKYKVPQLIVKVEKNINEILEKEYDNKEIAVSKLLYEQDKLRK